MHDRIRRRKVCLRHSNGSMMSRSYVVVVVHTHRQADVIFLHDWWETYISLSLFLMMILFRAKVSVNDMTIFRCQRVVFSFCWTIEIRKVSDKRDVSRQLTFSQQERELNDWANDSLIVSIDWLRLSFMFNVVQWMPCGLHIVADNDSL